MNFLEGFNKKIKEIEEANAIKPETSKSNGPGPGKKLCNQCNNYIGARTQTCKCGKSFAKFKQQELPITVSTLEPKEFVIPENPEYVYEHLRTDTWEKIQADYIVENKDSLSEKNQRIFVPSEWRYPCKTIDEVLNRTGVPWSVTLKEDLNRIIVKCIPTTNFRPHENHRLGMLQEMIVVELIDA